MSRWSVDPPWFYDPDPPEDEEYEITVQFKEWEDDWINDYWSDEWARAADIDASQADRVPGGICMGMDAS